MEVGVLGNANAGEERHANPDQNGPAAALQQAVGETVHRIPRQELLKASPGLAPPG